MSNLSQILQSIAKTSLAIVFAISVISGAWVAYEKWQDEEVTFFALNCTLVKAVDSQGAMESYPMVFTGKRKDNFPTAIYSSVGFLKNIETYLEMPTAKSSDSIIWKEKLPIIHKVATDVSISKVMNHYAYTSSLAGAITTINRTTLRYTAYSGPTPKSKPNTIRDCEIITEEEATRIAYDYSKRLIPDRKI